MWPGTVLANVESRRRARQVHRICLPEADENDEEEAEDDEAKVKHVVQHTIG